MFASLGAVAANISLAVLFIKGAHLGIQSLPLAYALSSVLQCICLLVFLQRRLVFSWKELLQGLKKPAISSALFSIACVLLLFIFQGQGAFPKLLLAGGGAVGVFLLSSFLLKSQELKEFFSSFKTQFTHNEQHT
jgi:peptidoglycan biosynthesis protein MviN/MurJ (putative lipid II flippase)